MHPVLLLSALLSASLPLAGAPNPDPAHIAQRGNGIIQVAPTGGALAVPHPLALVSPYREDIADLGHGGEVATEDVRNVQWAVQNVRAGGLVQLVPGAAGEAFQFGQSGIYLPGVRLTGVGRDAAGSPRTIIAGGMLAVRADFLVEGDRAQVSDLWFQGTREGAIYSAMAHYDRLEISGNKSTGTVPDEFLVHPPNGQFFAGALHFFFLANGAASVAPFTGALSPRCEIRELVVRGNVSDQASPVGGSEIEVAFSRYASLTIADNRVRSAGVSVEIDENLGEGSALTIENNDLAAAGTTALWVMGNEGARVAIEGNDLATGGENGVGAILSHRTPSAAFVVKRNHVALDQGVSAFFLGLSGPDALNGATFAGNVLTGTAGFGVLAFDSPGWDNTSSHNTFTGNDFSGLAAGALQVFLPAGAGFNLFAGNPGLDPASFVSLNPTNVLSLRACEGAACTR